MRNLWEGLRDCWLVLLILLVATVFYHQCAHAATWTNKQVMCEEFADTAKAGAILRDYGVTSSELTASLAADRPVYEKTHPELGLTDEDYANITALMLLTYEHLELSPEELHEYTFTNCLRGEKAPNMSRKYQPENKTY